MILEDCFGTEAGQTGAGLGEPELEVVIEVEDRQEISLVLAVDRMSLSGNPSWNGRLGSEMLSRSSHNPSLRTFAMI